MRIALVSFEFEGGANGGGIGTYTRNAAAMLAARGHSVEVFTSGTVNAATDGLGGMLVNTVACTRPAFPAAIVAAFAQRHATCPFDLVEGPEYGAEASEIASAYQALPLVVKLHGPSFTIQESNSRYVGWRRRARFALGALLRGRLPRDPWTYRADRDPERLHVFAADEVVSNSMATATRVAQQWGLSEKEISHIPNVFHPPTQLLNIGSKSEVPTILFVGKLEVRKGVLELAKAANILLKRDATLKFRFVGRDLPHPNDGRMLSEHLRIAFTDKEESLTITGGIPYAELITEYEGADICVFPSDWEASGFVCMEAMAAGRPVIGSTSGGMAELIDHGRTGLLTPPNCPRLLAGAILALLKDPERRSAMGVAGRQHVLHSCGPGAIGPLQDASYARAIAKAHRRAGE